jgi:hypothetical protein
MRIYLSRLMISSFEIWYFIMDLELTKYHRWVYHSSFIELYKYRYKIHRCIIEVCLMWPFHQFDAMNHNTFHLTDVFAERYSSRQEMSNKQVYWNPFYLIKETINPRKTKYFFSFLWIAQKERKCHLCTFRSYIGLVYLEF